MSGLLRDHPQRSPLCGRSAVWWASVNYIRGALEKCPTRNGQFLWRVNQKPIRNWRRGETASGKRWRRTGLAGQAGRGRNGETGNAPNVGQLRTSGAAMQSTKRGKDVGRKRFGSPNMPRSRRLSGDARWHQMAPPEKIEDRDLPSFQSVTISWARNAVNCRAVRRTYSE
jgi:hypothetical protein